MGGQIFISYRREDSSPWAGRLSDRLSNHFPSKQIFMDVDSVDLGEDFVKTIEGTVGSCDVLIAVIGKGWLTSCDQEGQRRLDNPEDFVRIEIATALKRDIRVIPVVVDGVSMPRSRDLPDDLKALARRNALQLSHDRFRADSERLIGAVERALETARAEYQRQREEKERLETERSETKAKERLEAERRQKEQQERLEAERSQTEAKEHLEAERQQKEQQERLKAECSQTEAKEHLEAERQQKEQQERLDAERREPEGKQRLEAERLEKEEKGRTEVENPETLLKKLHEQRERAEVKINERPEGEQWEKQRLEAQQREKNRVEAEQREKERLEAGRQEREPLELTDLKAATPDVISITGYYPDAATERREKAERLKTERRERKDVIGERLRRFGRLFARKYSETFFAPVGAGEHGEAEAKESLEVERRQKEHQERLEAEKQEKERVETGRQEREPLEQTDLKAAAPEVISITGYYPDAAAERREKAERLKTELREKERLEARRRRSGG
jgi:uncharacterized protein YqcC (DUF446 family)